MIRRFMMAVAAAWLCAAGGTALAQPALAKVRIGSFVTISDAGLFVAVEKGYFREQGIEAEFTKVNTSSVMMTSLASRHVDVGGGSPGAAIYNARRQGIEVKIVADKGSARPGHGFISVVTRPDLAAVVKSGADLRGRVVAVTGYFDGATMEVAMGRLLREGGLKESDVRFVNMSFSDIVAGLSTGRVEVGVLIEPLTTLAIEKKAATQWKHLDEIYPYQQAGVLIFGPSLLEKPDLARRFMVAYMKGVRFYNDALSGKASSEELFSILIKHTSVKNRALYSKMTFPGLNPDGVPNVEGMKNDMEWFVAAGRMKEPVKMDDIIDTSFAEAAVKQLGPYRR